MDQPGSNRPRAGKGKEPAAQEKRADRPARLFNNGASAGKMFACEAAAAEASRPIERVG